MLDFTDLPAFAKARVLVFGDVMLDRYWMGDVQRISPEAPVPVVLVNKTKACPGGAANVALNIVALEATTELFGLVGDDNEATQLESLLLNVNVRCHFERQKNLTTTTKLRVLGQNQQLLRMDFETNNAKPDCAALIQQLATALTTAHVLVLSDYAKGALSQSVAIIALAKQYGVPVLVDPKVSDFAAYRGATLITPNLKEFVAVVGPCQDEAEIIAKAQIQIKQHDLQAILITRGKEGMLLVEKNGATLNLSAHARDVFDVTGAGDTVIGVLASALAGGAQLQQAAKLANLAAGLVVKKLGAATVSVSELRHALQQSNETTAAIVNQKDLMSLINDAKTQGKRVVLTNGCFDILHAGHVQYLAQAKQLGDRLVVAVNDDASVTRLKGATRPLNPLLARMELLAALRSVDWVVSFSEDTPAALIANVLPDVLVKGADYQVHEIAGSEAVLKNGGEVKTVALTPGFSTTNLVNQIKQDKIS